MGGRCQGCYLAGLESPEKPISTAPLLTQPFFVGFKLPGLMPGTPAEMRVLPAEILGTPVDIRSLPARSGVMPVDMCSRGAALKPPALMLNRGGPQLERAGCWGADW